MILAPLLVRGDHWVLLSITPYKITIFDSLRYHTGDEAHRFARSLVQAFPQLRDARVESTRNWPQQMPGSNDCALFVMRAVLHILAIQPAQAVVHLFERRPLDLLLPHIPGTDRAGARTTGWLTQCQSKPVKDAFKARLLSNRPSSNRHPSAALDACALCGVISFYKSGAGSSRISMLPRHDENQAACAAP